MKCWPGRVRCSGRSAASARMESWYAQRSAGCPLRPARLNRGFTLTEVLIVAVVIGILLSFITAAGFSALTRAHAFAIQTEAGKLALAMEMFKQQYGSYPPANLTPPSTANDPDRLYQFVARAFPRYVQKLALDSGLTGTDQQRLRNDLQRTQSEGGKGLFLGDIPSEFSPAHALLFWLVGFSGDPADPFAGHRERMQGEDLASAFYAFDPERIGKRYDDGGTDVTSDDPQRQEMQTQLTAIYIPDTSGGGTFSNNSAAYLYFSSPYDVPYCYDKGNPELKFTAYAVASEKPFQVINAGLDRKIGRGGTSRDGEDADNAAHFSGQLMGD